ncbi:MAG: TonB-dependent receptor [Filimonas sp.]|nr:TonB-dependent receptor [Filimonas sp.]
MKTSVNTIKMLLLAGIAWLSAGNTYAQNSFRAVILSKTENTPLAGVKVSLQSDSTRITLSNNNGIAVLNGLPSGTTTVTFSYIGYKPQSTVVTLPDTTTHQVYMDADEKELDNVVVVSSTRGNDKIENATTKVEVLGQEEMNEESTLKPGNIASILGDVSGVQIQQSSATSGNSNIRIQGLDGRYTQMLRDGMPLFDGYSGGFGVLSIPPLDLKQIELIKGSASTLYGGGAIGGLVNLISKKPTYSPDASFLVNQTTLKETNINAYYAQRWKHIGFTMFAGETLQKEVDVNKDGLSDVPNIKSTVIHPTLFLYPSSKTSISLGWSGNFEKRLGGDMIAIGGGKDPAHPYFEKNALNRNLFTLISESRLDNSLTLNVKGSVSLFNRDETTNTYIFSGRQNNYYGEISLVKHLQKHTIVGGVNITGDDFKPSAATPAPVGNVSNNTIGIFAQDTWQLFEKTKLEGGLRLDHHADYGNFVLPRLALFQRFDEHWGSRIGFGMGYVTPNPLTPQIRDYSIYQLQPISPSSVPERSYGGSIEVNYKKEFGTESSLFINTAYFITQINHPVVATEDAAGNVNFSNASKPVRTSGLDIYTQLHVNAWEFYLGYTYTNAERTYLPANQFMPITPKNRLAGTVLYELENIFRIGVEASYNSYQYREDYSKTPGYLFIAVMAEKKFGPKWSLVLNCENLLDERQSKHEALYTGSITNPVFKTLWAPIDGRVVNLCLRFKPFAKK